MPKLDQSTGHVKMNPKQLSHRFEFPESVQTSRQSSHRNSLVLSESGIPDKPITATSTSLNSRNGGQRTSSTGSQKSVGKTSSSRKGALPTVTTEYSALSFSKKKKPAAKKSSSSSLNSSRKVSQSVSFDTQDLFQSFKKNDCSGFSSYFPTSAVNATKMAVRQSQDQTKLKELKYSADAYYGGLDVFLDDSVDALNIMVMKKRDAQAKSQFLQGHLDEAKTNLEGVMSAQRQLTLTIKNTENANGRLGEECDQLRQSVAEMRTRLQVASTEEEDNKLKMISNLIEVKQSVEENAAQLGNEQELNRETLNTDAEELRELEKLIAVRDRLRYTLQDRVRECNRQEQQKLEMVRKKEILLESLIQNEQCVDVVKAPRLSLVCTKRISIAQKDNKENSLLSSGSKLAPVRQTKRGAHKRVKSNFEMEKPKI